jgi:hypothetical protein
MTEIAGRRHRRAMVMSAVAMVAAITAASVLTAGSAIASRPPSASIPLRTSLEIRQIASMFTAYPCPPGSVDIDPADDCLSLTRTGMTVTAVQSTYVRKQFVSFPVPKGKPSVVRPVFWATLRLTSSGAARLLAITRDVYRLPKPHNGLADFVHGRYIETTYFTSPETKGLLSFFFVSRAQAESFLAQLLHG